MAIRVWIINGIPLLAKWNLILFDFFLESKPLFTESATEREVNAVDSEHAKNVANDAWRLAQLERSTSDPKHAYSKFGTGNLSTLMEIPKEKGIQVRPLPVDRIIQPKDDPKLNDHVLLLIFFLIHHRYRHENDLT